MDSAATFGSLASHCPSLRTLHVSVPPFTPREAVCGHGHQPAANLTSIGIHGSSDEEGLRPLNSPRRDRGLGLVQLSLPWRCWLFVFVAPPAYCVARCWFDGHPI